MASVQAPKEQAAAHPAQWLISQVNVPSLDATLESARTAPPKGYMISQPGELVCNRRQCTLVVRHC
ncbi:hypothetical protein ABIC86_005201 [Paenibacillus sp. DS2363]|nr:hypothetical protein [Paenibacillus xylanexedens]